MSKYSEIENLSEWSILDHHVSSMMLYDWQVMGEFLRLLEVCEIPSGTKLAMGIISGYLGYGANRTKCDRLPVKFMILPGDKIKIFDSGNNSDILKAEIERTGTLPFIGKVLELSISMKEKKLSDKLMPEGYIHCVGCGKLFKKVGKQLFCSILCRNRYTVRKFRAKRKKVAV